MSLVEHRGQTSGHFRHNGCPHMQPMDSEIMFFFSTLTCNIVCNIQLAKDYEQDVTTTIIVMKYMSLLLAVLLSNN